MRRSASRRKPRARPSISGPKATRRRPALTRRRSGRIRSSTNSSRTLQAYDNILDDKTTLFFPPDAEVLRLLHFDAQPAPGEPSPDATTPVGAAGSPQEPSAVSADADRLLKKNRGKSSDDVCGRPGSHRRSGASRGAPRRRRRRRGRARNCGSRYWYLIALAGRAHGVLGLRLLCCRAPTSVRWCVGSAPSRSRSDPACTTGSHGLSTKSTS